MNERFEEMIKDLSPELQEKAKNCTSFEELSELLADNDIEMPEDALEMVSGGNACDTAVEKKKPCPLCGYSPVSVLFTGNFKCDSCGCIFDDKGNVIKVQTKKDNNDFHIDTSRL